MAPNDSVVRRSKVTKTKSMHSNSNGSSSHPLHPSKKRKREHAIQTPTVRAKEIEDAASDTASDTASDSVSDESEGETIQEAETKAVKKESKTFADLGIIDSLVEACTNLGFKAPSPIQAESIPIALEGRDIIGIAETGSGKTAAFALPILQALLSKPQPLFALVLAPTRELAYQTSDQFSALGSLINVKTAVLVGGMDMVSQQIALGKNPHVVVATPGRLLDHLENTRGFSLRNLKYLVMDEADRILDMDFGREMDKILKVLPRDNRKTYLFSATMSSKVEALKRASLKNPVRIAVSEDLSARDLARLHPGATDESGNPKHRTVSTLLQSFLLVPDIRKDHYALALLSGPFRGHSTIVFARTVHHVSYLTYFLRALGLGAIPLHGQLSQSARLSALNKFKAKARDIMVATDVAARGLDIPAVDLVLNYDLPGDSKTYVHRVGRTARAGRSGHAVSFVSQYGVEVWQRIELALGHKVDEYGGIGKEEAMSLGESVSEAQRAAIKELKIENEKKDRRAKKASGKGVGIASGRKRGREDMDREEG